MVNKLVSVDEDFNLPTEVQEQLVGPVRDEFETLTDAATASATAAATSAATATTSATDANTARIAAEAAAALATLPTDAVVAGFVADTGSDSRAALDAVFQTSAGLDDAAAALVATGSDTRTTLDTRYARYAEGLFASRPTASAAGAGAQYYATNTLEMYQSNGSTWRTISNAGEVQRNAITTLQSTTGVLDVVGLTASWTAGERPVEFGFSGDLAHTVSGTRVTLAAYLDGATGVNHLGAVNIFPSAGSDVWQVASFNYAIPALTPGTAHSIRLTMSTPSGTARISNALIKVTSR